MRAHLAGLSKAQAAARPQEGEWSVDEITAHFILCERDYQSWVADMLNDVEIEGWLEMRPNVQPRITALTSRLGTLPALLEELAKAKAETAAMIEAISPAFARDRKHIYRRLAQWAVEEAPNHYYDEHKGQLQAAIEAAKVKV
jgi:hypothetical protein